MQAHINTQPDVVVAFPTESASRRAPIGTPHRRCTVVPLRRGHAAKRVGVLLKVRCLHAEIEALTTGLRRHQNEESRGASPRR
jgi:hypothetical protein